MTETAAVTQHRLGVVLAPLRPCPPWTSPESFGPWFSVGVCCKISLHFRRSRRLGYFAFALVPTPHPRCSEISPAYFPRGFLIRFLSSSGLRDDKAVSILWRLRARLCRVCTRLCDCRGHTRHCINNKVSLWSPPAPTRYKVIRPD
jgi:hypothetical protein